MKTFLTERRVTSKKYFHRSSYENFTLVFICPPFSLLDDTHLIYFMHFDAFKKKMFSSVIHIFLSLQS